MIIAGAIEAIEQNNKNNIRLPGVVINLAINNGCSLTSACGAACIFQMMAVPSRKSMPWESSMSCLHEIRAAPSLPGGAPLVQTLLLAEKEPTETPGRLLDVQQLVYDLPTTHRPSNFGIITHGLGIPRCLPQLKEFPLDFVLTSLDGEPSTHRRGPQLFSPALENILMLKENGGAKRIGINTVLEEGTSASVLQLGRRLRGLPIDAWKISSKLVPDGSAIINEVASKPFADFVDRIVDEQHDSQLSIEMICDTASFDEMAQRWPGAAIRSSGWKSLLQIPSTRIVCSLLNSDPTHFFRIRWDGEILSPDDLRRRGTAHGQLGRLAPGRLTELFESSYHAIIRARGVQAA